MAENGILNNVGVSKRSATGITEVSIMEKHGGPITIQQVQNGVIVTPEVGGHEVVRTDAAFVFTKIEDFEEHLRGIFTFADPENDEPEADDG